MNQALTARGLPSAISLEKRLTDSGLSLGNLRQAFEFYCKFHCYATDLAAQLEKTRESTQDNIMLFIFAGWIMVIVVGTASMFAVAVALYIR
jgi:hypothetical protein